jgi:hypothetical protein
MLLSPFLWTLDFFLDYPLLRLLLFGTGVGVGIFFVSGSDFGRDWNEE